MRKPVQLITIASCIALPYGTQAQGLEDLRNSVRQDIQHSDFGAALVGLVNLTEELELTGALYTVDDPNNTRINALSLPAVATFYPWADSGPGLYVEGVVGYAALSSDSFNIFENTDLITEVDWAWTTYGGLGGVGVEFEPVDRLKLTPILNLALSRIENDASYRGPGAAFSAEILDDIVLNWDATLMSLGGALRLDWIYPLSDDMAFETVARYDYRWSKTLQSTDTAQDFSTDSQLFTLRADVTGATGWSPFGWPLGWRAIAGYRRYGDKTGRALGFYDFYQLGGAIELDSGNAIALIGGIKLTSSVIFGDQVSGWSIGLGADF